MAFSDVSSVDIVLGGGKAGDGRYNVVVVYLNGRPAVQFLRRGDVYLVDDVPVSPGYVDRVLNAMVKMMRVEPEVREVEDGMVVRMSAVDAVRRIADFLNAVMGEIRAQRYWRTYGGLAARWRAGRILAGR